MTDSYRIKKSEYSSNNPDTYIDIDLGGINTTASDLTLAGRTREYGESYNENILHLLENFDSPEATETQAETIYHAIPAVLINPIDGQVWFNSTRKIPYVYFRGRWYPKAEVGDIASNWGTIASGVALPIPVGAQGQTFTYDECSWIISPTYVPVETKLVTCTSDSGTGVVTVQYTNTSDVVVPSEAFYQIVAIRGNDLLGGNTASGLRALIDTYLIREQVPPLNSFPTTTTSADSVTIAASGATGGHTYRYTWSRVSPTTFPAGYIIEPVVTSNTSPVAQFAITVSSPGVFVSTQKVVRGATFVCLVEEMDGVTPVGDVLTLPVRVEFYNY
jgi:hypothetical protein